MSDSASPDKRAPAANGMATATGGVGVGAILAGIAQALGTNTAAGALILYIVPVASILTSAIINFVDAQVGEFSRRVSLHLKLRSMRRRLNAISVSGAKKRALKEKIDEIELRLIEAEVNELRPGNGRNTL